MSDSSTSTCQPDASELVQRYNSEVNKVLAAADVKEALAKNGVDRRGGTAGEFGAFLNGDRAKWQRIIKDANVKIE